MATSGTVEIGGELEWQNNLKWEDQSIFQTSQAESSTIFQNEMILHSFFPFFSISDCVLIMAVLSLVLVLFDVAFTMHHEVC